MSQVITYFSLFFLLDCMTQGHNNFLNKGFVFCWLCPTRERLSIDAGYKSNVLSTILLVLKILKYISMYMHDKLFVFLIEINDT